MMRRALLLPSVAALALAGCSMNPRLEKPAAPVAAAYPAAEAIDAANAAAMPWREMFGDPRLQRLIELALAENRDLRLALLDAEAARAQYRIQDNSRLPQIEAQGSYNRQRIPSSVAGNAIGGIPGQAGGPSGFEFQQYGAQGVLTNFEIDLFGRLRSLSEAAFERYLASVEGHRAARITLIGSVVDAYLAERAAEEQLALTERTLASFRQSLDITRRLHEAQQTSGLELSQAEGLVRQAEADREGRTRALAQSRNALVLLVGAPLPADLPPPLPLAEQPIRVALPAGLPSDLLVNRPDIRQAEHELVAANADVGAARAAFFPSLSITGLLGFASPAFSSLFDGANHTWSFTPQIRQPIFPLGGLDGDLDLAKVRKSAAIASYEKAIQEAFRDVADGLAGRATLTRQREAQAAAATASARRADLADLRYRAGVDSRLELLDAQRSNYAAQQALLDLRREELSNAARLYRALGGGDMPTPEPRT